MAVFSITTITAKGLALIAKGQLGAEIHFTRMQIGSGELTGQDPEQLTALIDPIAYFAINSMANNGGTAQVRGIYENSSLPAPVYVCEIGLFADDPDEGEILYAYANAGAQGDNIPAYASGPYSKMHKLNVAIGNADDVTITVPVDAYALASDVGNMQSVPTTSKDAAGAITELFQSVSDGKALVAAAITDKGIPTAADDSFAEMADNIDDIPVGPDTSDATVVAGDMRAGKIAYGAAGRVVGNVPVQAGGNVVPGAADIVKAAGIYDTPITVKGVVVPAAKVLNDTTIAGTKGTMVDRSAGNHASGAPTRNGTTLELPIPANAYYGTAAKITRNEPNWIPGNIPEGMSMFGLAGTKKEGIPGKYPAFTANNFYYSYRNDQLYMPGFSSAGKIYVVGRSKNIAIGNTAQEKTFNIFEYNSAGTIISTVPIDTANNWIPAGTYKDFFYVRAGYDSATVYKYSYAGTRLETHNSGITTSFSDVLTGFCVNPIRNVISYYHRNSQNYRLHSLTTGTLLATTPANIGDSYPNSFWLDGDKGLIVLTASSMSNGYIGQIMFNGSSWSITSFSPNNLHDIVSMLRLAFHYE